MNGVCGISDFMSEPGAGFLLLLYQTSNRCIYSHYEHKTKKKWEQGRRKKVESASKNPIVKINSVQSVVAVVVFRKHLHILCANGDHNVKRAKNYMESVFSLYIFPWSFFVRSYAFIPLVPHSFNFLHTDPGPLLVSPDASK